MTHALHTPHKRLLGYMLATLFPVLLASGCSHQAGSNHANQTATISIVGTNDVHGQLVAQAGRGGLAVFSGYVDALRAERSDQNSGVLLIDAGDMWQGTLESNLSEGALTVQAYNALGYTAAAIGNHEFDFGPIGERSTPDAANTDARGALKIRATEAEFPLLAANLIDLGTNEPVDWPNVSPSTLVDVAGIKVGIIGVMTFDALAATIAANVRGLRVAPLAPTIASEATKLRAQGAALVIVTAHAGGSCDNFDNPKDLSSCDLDDEIFRVARDIPNGLVDQIIAGHHHRGIAHVVNDILVTASFSSTRSFGRVDFRVDKRSNTVTNRKIFAPRRPCPYVEKDTGQCVWENSNDANVVTASYEGRAITPDPTVSAIVNNAKQQAKELKASKLGIYLDSPITLENNPESALGHLMTDALLATSDADISMHNISGGIRANLDQGELTFGDIYQMFPFDNRVVELNISGSELRQIIAGQVRKREKRAGFSGMKVYVECRANQMSVKMLRSDNSEIKDSDNVKLAVNDFLALGGDSILKPIIPEEGFEYPSDTPLARDAVIEWLSTGPSRLNADMFLGGKNTRWHVANTIPTECSL